MTSFHESVCHYGVMTYNDRYARVMELVDVPDSKSGGFGRAGSSPALGTSGVG